MVVQANLQLSNCTSFMKVAVRLSKLIFSNNYLQGNGTNLMQRPFIAGMLKHTIVKCMLPKPETFYSTCRFSEGQRRRGRKELLLNRNSKAVLI